MGIRETSVVKHWLKFEMIVYELYYSTVFVLYKDFCDLAH